MSTKSPHKYIAGKRRGGDIAASNDNFRFY